jgi:type II secretory pathway component GspD/PulD (secretin)
MYTTQRLLGTVACAALLALPAVAQDAPAEPEVIELFDSDEAAQSGQKIETTETGEFDLNITDLEITKVLQVLSIEGQKNIIASRGVENTKVSASLYKVSFEEALQSILEPNGFGYIEEGNFIYVMTKEEIEKRELADRKLVTKILRLDYLRADEAAGFVTPMLSDNGSITASGNVEDGIDPSLDDAGADNYAGPPTLVIRDFEDSVEEIVSVLEDLDRQPKQVIIEATVLRATLTENNQFGVDFSLFTDLTGASPLDIIDNAITGGAPTSERLGAIQSNVGDVASQSGGVKLGFVAGDAAVFVSALDSVTDTTLIATPKVTVLDRNKTSILVGDKIAYLSTTVTETSETQTVEFLEVGTQLNVRPFVSSDGSVRLELRPSVSDATIRTIGTTDAPDESTVELTTNVIVESGQTIVLGGLFTDDSSVNRSQVPGLGDVPLLGAAFQGQNDTVGRSEVIFLVKATVVENETLIQLGDEATNRIDVARLAQREELLPWSMSKLTSTHFMNARKHYDEALTLTGEARDKKMAEALYSVDMALHMNASMVDALILKEKITGEAAYIKYEESLVNQTYDAVLDAEMKLLDIEAMPEEKAEVELPELPTGEALVEPEPVTDAANATEAPTEQAQAEADEAWLEAALADEFGEATPQADATEEAVEDDVIVIELEIEGEPEAQADATEQAEETDDDVIVIELEQQTESNTQAGVETQTD